MNFSLLPQLHFLPFAPLRIHVFNVGQGDSILLTSPSGKHILVDGGPDLSPVNHLAKVLPFFHRTIDLLVLTHPNTDHLVAIPTILQQYSVRAALLPRAALSLPLYQDIVQTLVQRDIPILTPHPSMDIDFGDGVVLDVLWPSELSAQWVQNPNNTSVVLRVIFGDRSILLTGDIEEKAEMAILASGADLRSTLLKLAHHGSKTSTSTGFLLASSPQKAIVSAGKNNRYHHPSPIILSRLRHHHITVVNTAESGTIIEEL